MSPYWAFSPVDRYPSGIRGDLSPEISLLADNLDTVMENDILPSLYKKVNFPPLTYTPSPKACGKVDIAVFDLFFEDGMYAGTVRIFDWSLMDLVFE